jgi:alternate signal-mediated exported protein
MNRSTKGALAASAAGAVLLGGAGSLAYWNNNDTIGGAAIASGTLTLTQEGPQTCSDWTLDAAGGATTYNPGVTLVVPGDVITRTCDYTVTASGEHLSATLGITPPVYQAGHDADLQGALTLGATYTLNGSSVSDGQAVTSADTGHALHAVITVTFKDTTSGVVAQGMSTVLDDITVGLTQAHA